MNPDRADEFIGRGGAKRTPAKNEVFNIVSPIGATDKTRFHSDVPMELHHVYTQFTGVPPSASPLPKPLIVLTDFLPDTNNSFIIFSLVPAQQTVDELVNHREAGVLVQTLGDADALGRLVVLEQCRHDARQGECRAVERVTQMCLLVVATIAALQTVSLVGLKI